MSDAEFWDKQAEFWHNQSRRWRRLMWFWIIFGVLEAAQAVFYIGRIAHWWH